MDEKKVIFIGGTSYSGSTFLDMIISNDEKGFSCGEVNALFYPYRKHHYNPECGCGDPDCSIWKGIQNIPPKTLFQELFKKLKHIDFIVDSSKMVPWQYKYVKLLRKQNIKTKHLLIWKTPYELAYSYNKRRQLKRWKGKWIQYHLKYIAFIHNFKAVKYADFVNNNEVLEKICEYLEIDYFPDKINYWEKKHHILFGNDSAKIINNNSDSGQLSRVKEKILNKTNQSILDIDNKANRIYYDKIADSVVIKEVDKTISKKTIQKILNVLNQHDLLIPAEPPTKPDLRYPLFLFKFWTLLKYNFMMGIKHCNYLLYYKLGIKSPLNF